MAIDLTKEKPLSLTQATKKGCEFWVDDKPPHVSTLWRWIRIWISGVKLEHVRVGHRVCTTRESLNRFFNALAAADAEPATVTKTEPRSSRRRTEQQRERDISQAEARLRGE